MVDLRSGMSGAMVIEAPPAPEPGQVSAPGVRAPCWATTLAPLTVSVAVCASALSVSGLTVKLRLGCAPPVGKNVSRISAACWKRRSVCGRKRLGDVGIAAPRPGFRAGVGERREVGGEELVDNAARREHAREIGERHVAVAAVERVVVVDDLLHGPVTSCVIWSVSCEMVRLLASPAASRATLSIMPAAAAAGA